MKLFQNLSIVLAEEVIKSLFLFIALVAILFNIAERFEQFFRGSPKEHSCIIISKSIFWFRRRSSLKVFIFLALAAILFNVAERFEQFRWTVTYGTFLYHYFKIDALVKEEKSFKGFSNFSSGGHIVQQSGTV